jgi:hypothetical protein
MQRRQTELIGGRLTEQNLLEVGRVVRLSECIANRWSIRGGGMHQSVRLYNLTHLTTQAG